MKKYQYTKKKRENENGGDGEERKSSPSAPSDTRRMLSLVSFTIFGVVGDREEGRRDGRSPLPPFISFGPRTNDRPRVVPTPPPKNRLLTYHLPTYAVPVWISEEPEE